jgi:hypothetical protein
MFKCGSVIGTEGEWSSNRISKIAQCSVGDADKRKRADLAIRRVRGEGESRKGSVRCGHRGCCLEVRTEEQVARIVLEDDSPAVVNHRSY